MSPSWAVLRARYEDNAFFHRVDLACDTPCRFDHAASNEVPSAGRARSLAVLPDPPFLRHHINLLAGILSCYPSSSVGLRSLRDPQTVRFATALVSKTGKSPCEEGWSTTASSWQTPTAVTLPGVTPEVLSPAAAAS